MFNPTIETTTILKLLEDEDQVKDQKKTKEEENIEAEIKQLIDLLDRLTFYYEQIKKALININETYETLDAKYKDDNTAANIKNIKNINSLFKYKNKSKDIIIPIDFDYSKDNSSGIIELYNLLNLKCKDNNEPCLFIMQNIKIIDDLMNEIKRHNTDISY